MLRNAPQGPPPRSDSGSEGTDELSAASDRLVPQNRAKVDLVAAGRGVDSALF